MKKVFKFVLPHQARPVVKMQKGAQILSVQIQMEQICIWALVDPSAEMEDRSFSVIGTGHEIFDPHETGWDLKYLDSVQLQGGAFVFHVFELIPN